MLLRFEIVFLMLINDRYLAFLKAILVLILKQNFRSLEFGHQKFQMLKLLPF